MCQKLTTCILCPKVKANFLSMGGLVLCCTETGGPIPQQTTKNPDLGGWDVLFLRVPLECPRPDSEVEKSPVSVHTPGASYYAPPVALTEQEWKEELTAKCDRVAGQWAELITHLEHIDRLKATGSDQEELAAFFLLKMRKMEKTIESLGD